MHNAYSQAQFTDTKTPNTHAHSHYTQISAMNVAHIVLYIAQIMPNASCTGLQVITLCRCDMSKPEVAKHVTLTF